ncbi:MAG: SpoIIE family protein phosphatase [Microscillaceae bacterium]|jgi:serine phosphatase RsbU (regulator of sigma subunit)|nr:SpoIIE family protein phosphatase [Microscillaceae bacterium]
MRISFYIFFWLLTLSSYAQKTWVLNEKNERYSLGKGVEYLEDPSHLWSFEQISQPTYQKQFKKSNQEFLNFGYSNSAYWIRFGVQKRTDDDNTWLLQLSHPLVDSVTVYFVDKKTGKVSSHATGGVLPFATRQIANPNFVFYLPLFHSPDLLVYVHCRGRNAKQFPLSVFTEKYFLEKTRQESIQIGMFTGFFIAIISYNLFLFFSLRSLSYLYYIIYMSGFVLLQLALGGLLHEYFPARWAVLANLSNLFFVGFTVFFGNQFAKQFLRVDKFMPRFYRAFWILDILGLAIMLLTLASVSYYHEILVFLPPLASLTAFLTVVIQFPSSLYILWRGYRPATFYVLAWTALFGGILIYVLGVSGLWSGLRRTITTIRLGSAIEAVLLALGLADRINIVEQEKKDLIIAQNRDLEAKVKARTEEISEKNQELEQQNQEILAQRDAIEQKNLAINEAFEEIKDKNQEIISSINYAQRIQNAMLPTYDEIHKLLPESFILFRPREIVSGDFYWILEKDQKIVLAVVDCTGHGVPGAFMSMIGNDLLNEIVGLRGITSAGQILNQLHKGVRTVLRQTETNNQDGMDIALCVIDKAQFTLDFAGARNGLVMIQNGELQYFKGDKMSIGGFQKEEERNFSNQIIQLNPDNQAIAPIFYLFSDGFQDQFGGEKGKKFMLKTLLSELQKIHSLPLNQQKNHLNQTLEAWMQADNSKQIDDVLVFGFRI